LGLWLVLIWRKFSARPHKGFADVQEATPLYAVLQNIQVENVMFAC
jgi:hypothetical protein